MKEQAIVFVLGDERGLNVVVQTQDLLTYTHTNARFILGEHSFTVKARPRQEQTARVVWDVLRRNSIPIIGHYSLEISNISRFEGVNDIWGVAANGISDIWGEAFWIRTTGTEPTGVLTTALADLQSKKGKDSVPGGSRSAGWNVYLEGLLRGCMSLAGRQGVLQKFIGSQEYLENFDGEIVSRREPHLPLIGSLCLTGVLLLLWTVTIVSGWQPRVDERSAWVHMFESVETVKDFGNTPNERIPLE